MDEFNGGLNNGLSVRDKRNLEMFLKVCSLNFRYFFITVKNINTGKKVNYTYFIYHKIITELYEYDYFAFCIQN